MIGPLRAWKSSKNSCEVTTHFTFIILSNATKHTCYTYYQGISRYITRLLPARILLQTSHHPADIRLKAQKNPTVPTIAMAVPVQRRRSSVLLVLGLALALALMRPKHPEGKGGGSGNRGKDRESF